jgi:hypothetical protein
MDTVHKGDDDDDDNNNNNNNSEIVTAQDQALKNEVLCHKNTI